jgi:peroxiredoxin-like protein
MATKSKEHAFPVAVEWEGARRVRVGVHRKAPLAVATPAQFHREADPSIWSPEDLLTAAAASCLAVTIAGAAERDELLLEELSVDATGIVGRRDDGTFGFTRIEQRVRVAVPVGDEGRARQLVERAESTCLVAASLDAEVETEVNVVGLALGGVAGARLRDA